jgi:curved DNA-binding protein CbpA
MATNLYALFGLTADAHPDVIKAAYRALAKQYHPDGAGAGDPEATAKFIELQNAYEILGNEELRARYDASHSQGNDEEIDDEPEASIDPDEIWNKKAQERPDIDRIHAILFAYSPALGNRFRLAVISDECTDDPAEFAADLERSYIEKYFGKHPDVQALARRFLSQGNRTAAKELNVAVKVIDPSNPDRFKSLVADFEKRYGGLKEEKPAAAPQADKVRKKAFPFDLRYVFAAFILVLIASIGIPTTYYFFKPTLPDHENRSEPVTVDLTLDKGSLTPDIESGKVYNDRIVPEATQIVPERDPKTAKSYPEVTADDLPYSEDTPVVIALPTVDAEEGGGLTTITKQAPADPIQESFARWPAASILDSLTQRGVSADAANSLVSSIEALVPIGSISRDTPLSWFIAEEIDENGVVTVVPTSLEIKISPREVITVTIDGNGKYAAEISGARRKALVIGNANYRRIPWLSNPDEDAVLISQSLATLGFEVTRLIDGSESEMKDAVKSFANSLGSGVEMALIFYSGHAVEIQSQNYLLPVDILSSSTEAQIERRSINLSTVLQQMQERQVPTKIVIVDACRNNPFQGTTKSVGLAPVLAQGGAFIAYATAPGTVALDGSSSTGNSPYSAALAEALRRPASTIEDTFKSVRAEVMRRTDNQQVPWDGSSLTGVVSLAAVGSPRQVKDFHRDQSNSKYEDQDGPYDAEPTLLEVEPPAPMPVPGSTNESNYAPKPRLKPRIVLVQPPSDPKPIVIGESSSRPYARASEYEVCFRALDPMKDAWDQRNFERDWVAEAQRRSYSVNWCLTKINRAVTPPVLHSPGEQG